jgi:hypothetical protein
MQLKVSAHFNTYTKIEMIEQLHGCFRKDGYANSGKIPFF